MTCHLCGAKKPGKSFHCQRCDAPICRDCRNDLVNLCNECIERQNQIEEYQDYERRRILEIEDGAEL